MTDWMRRAGGCGCAAVMAVILVVGIVVLGLAALRAPLPGDQSAPVSADVPPAAPAAVAPIDIDAAGRTADQLAEWSAPLEEATGIGGQALRAYGNAELYAQRAWPECNLRWNTLAGIGYVETRHGTYNGNWLRPSHLDANGYPEPPIVGIPLDGTNNTARILDTDGGELDGDTEFDRAVGPLQFIPGTWANLGVDANGDGAADPNQIDDAAVGAAALLCGGGRDLNHARDWQDAVLAYNYSYDYVTRVAEAANAYALGQRAHS